MTARNVTITVLTGLLILSAMLIAGCEYMQTEGPPEIVAFTVNPAEITAGEKATLLWNVTGAITVTIEPGIGTAPVAGTKEVSPAATTTYILTATNLVESITGSVTLTIIPETEAEETVPPGESPPVKPELTAEQYYTNGIFLTEKGRYEHAILEFNEAIEMEHDYSDAYYGRGLAYYYKGDCTHAISDYTRAIELNAELIAAYYDRAMAFSMCHRQSEAIADFKRFIELSDDLSLVEKAEKELQTLESRQYWY
jgi:hypothetical protein